MSSACQGAGGGGPGTRYTYAELEGLWINAGGAASLAPIAAAIAEVSPDLKLEHESDSVSLRWQDLVDKEQETWPIQFLVPGGAYIYQAK